MPHAFPRAFALVLASSPGLLWGQTLESRCLIPGARPGRAIGHATSHAAELRNNALAVRFSLGPSGAWEGELVNRFNNRRASLSGNLFALHLKSGETLSSAAMSVSQGPRIVAIFPIRNAPKLASRLGGKAIEARFVSPDRNLAVDWRAILLDGSNYFREECTFHVLNSAIDADQVILVDAEVPHADVTGTVLGSPVASDAFFCGFEQPMSKSSVDGGHAKCLLERKLPLQPGVPVAYSAVYGVSPAGQMRRAFLNYVERERAHPYRPFLHYNSWYDIGYGNTYDEGECLDSINAFGEELVRKRGVKLSSYLFDDGWDDTHTVWKFHSGFPHGFTPLKEAAAKYGAAPGVWLSPWGGYADARTNRLATGKAEGYEIDSEGYALSGPKYFKLFRQVCLDFVGKYGVNQFKFDGTGSPDKQYPGSKFASDFEAAIQLISDLRSAKPELFVNLTTGTWPSPFWLRYADSTWRGGDDHSFAGVGTNRQRWITYRDGDTYHGVVQKGHLYPLTSLMLHGLIYAKHAHNLSTDPGNDFRSEVRDYFGNGTQLQEMYVTHSLLSKQNWDDIAESAKWSQANSDVLVDSHWLGGDPFKLQVYGWASWSPRKGIVVLRNPSDKPQSFSLDITKAFELPTGGARHFWVHSPYKSDAGQPHLLLRAGHPTVVNLKPFQVLVWDAVPSR